LLKVDEQEKERTIESLKVKLAEFDSKVMEGIEAQCKRTASDIESKLALHQQQTLTKMGDLQRKMEELNKLDEKFKENGSDATKRVMKYDEEISKLSTELDKLKNVDVRLVALEQDRKENEPELKSLLKIAADPLSKVIIFLECFWAPWYNQC
jgi:predicted transcriptional regulator